MQQYRDAIASIESAGSGDYAAIGPTNPRLGRALGRYQIMEANIGPWSRDALGREVTPEEFLANPQMQDAIFDAKFGGYVNQFGPEGAAQAWFAGPGGVGKTDRQDVLGTSVGEYGQKFASALGMTPQQVAQRPMQQMQAPPPMPAMMPQQPQDPFEGMGIFSKMLAKRGVYQNADAAPIANLWYALEGRKEAPQGGILGLLNG